MLKEALHHFSRYAGSKELPQNLPATSAPLDELNTCTLRLGISAMVQVNVVVLVTVGPPTRSVTHALHQVTLSSHCTLQFAPILS